MRHLKDQILDGEMICPLPPLRIRTVLLNFSKDEQKQYDLRWRTARGQAHSTYERVGRQKVRISVNFIALKYLDAGEIIFSQQLGTAIAQVLLVAVPPNSHRS